MTKCDEPAYLHNPFLNKGHDYTATELEKMARDNDSQAAAAHRRGDHRTAAMHERSARTLRRQPDPVKSTLKPAPTGQAVKPTELDPSVLDSVTMHAAPKKAAPKPDPSPTPAAKPTPWRGF
jgi:hypothetical protein